MCGLYLYVLDVCLTRASDASLGGCSRETEQKTENQGKQNRKQRIRGNRTEIRVSKETEQKTECQGNQNRNHSFRGNRTENRVSGETEQKTEFPNRNQSFRGVWGNNVMDTHLKCHIQFLPEFNIRLAEQKLIITIRCQHAAMSFLLFCVLDLGNDGHFNSFK